MPNVPHAMQTVHEERMVHSDVKPANLLMVEGGLKLIDFGITRRCQSDTTAIQRETATGTVRYMSPESIKITSGAAPPSGELRVCA